jgi:hypothetical protein
MQKTKKAAYVTRSTRYGAADVKFVDDLRHDVAPEDAALPVEHGGMPNADPRPRFAATHGSPVADRAEDLVRGIGEQQRRSCAQDVLRRRRAARCRACYRPSAARIASSLLLRERMIGDPPGRS